MVSPHLENISHFKNQIMTPLHNNLVEQLPTKSVTAAAHLKFVFLLVVLPPPLVVLIRVTNLFYILSMQVIKL